ncbi:MAG: hypothetical protein ACKVOU_00685 [Cytophagales bacterium]
MKLLFLAPLGFITFMAFSTHIDTPTLRKNFYASVNDGKKARLFLSELEKNKDDLSPIEHGYRAAVNMVMANHVFNPYSKFKYFIDGKNELEVAISANTKNVELKLIRFAIQSNVPSFLGYHSNIMEDKIVLIENLSLLANEKQPDTELVKIMKQYLTDSKYCTEAEKQSIKKM